MPRTDPLNHLPAEVETDAETEVLVSPPSSPSRSTQSPTAAPITDEAHLQRSPVLPVSSTPPDTPPPADPSFHSLSTDMSQSFGLPTPPHQTSIIQAAARPTSHNNTIAPHTGFLTQALQSASADRCLDIIKALQGPFYHKLVFDNITPEEYNTLSLLVFEDHRYRFSAKLVYHPDLSQLVMMVPYEIHKLAMNNFSQRVHDLLQPFRLSNDMDVTVIVNGNLAISDRDFEVVPDFHLSLRSMHNHGGQALIPWWVGKCGFSSTVTTMLRQLGAAAEMAPEMDLTLVISIREKKHKPPPCGHVLRTSPKLHRSDFNHTTSVIMLDSIIVGGVSWVEIKSIKLHVLLHREDGNFDFSGEGPLCAQGENMFMSFFKISRHIST
ncbi:hypothetical protein PAXINDRAFT_16770 [Paxillus involutus ATCC 200175]|uniref:Uncharacterized protein n=1 Tax=Paxillus involutus ATCC 200175 TaxID=664439 RepID=A0A0C9SR74_PAXIN|nr:hypothetical protein PAXINDRAFT_16770 [Paxillus involutus ATCC 200175]